MDLDDVDPSLRKAVRRVPSINPRSAFLRFVGRVAFHFIPVPRIPGVAVSVVELGDVRLRVYRPERQSGDGALFWIHGGGLVVGSPRQDEALCGTTARELGIAVVSAGYRFAPEHPFPAAHEDVYAAWRTAVLNADRIGADPERFVIGGESAGGGLAATLVQRVHDSDDIQPLGQWLFAPMLDDRTAADRSLDAVDHLVWNNRANRYAWGAYLGVDPGADEVPEYAVAARREELGGLPPAYIAVGDVELFHDECREYARRLEEAGVPVTLDVVEGAPHGFENWAKDSEPARALLGRARAWLRSALGGD